MTINDAVERIGDLENVAGDYLEELAREVFLAPALSGAVFPRAISRLLAVERMLKIAPMIYDTPFDFIDLDVFQLVAHDLYPDGEPEGGVNMRDRLRPVAFDVAYSVEKDTTWEQFEELVKQRLTAEAVLQMKSELAASTDPAVQLLASGAVNEHSSFADLGAAVREFYSVSPENAPAPARH